MAKIHPISGFPEWLPRERIVEQTFLDTIRRTFELHGFASVETRSVEPVDVFFGKGEADNEPVVTLSSNYEHSFTANTKLTNKFLAESGSDNTAVQNDIALSVNMTKSFALAVGFGVRYNSDPPPLADATDTLTTVNLVYSIQ